VNDELKDIRAILSEAMEKSPAERAAYLDVACAGNAPLRREVESLLRLEHEVGDFLQIPAVISYIPGDESPMVEQPGSLIGRYRLLEKIGEGGMAVVYMAEQERPIRRKVALKIIKLGMDTQQVIARFEAERQALAMMDHPNIAKVLDGGTTETGRPYFVMDLVPGSPITAYCDENRLTIEERLRLFISVCNAVQHAHQKGIIHRDIKPSNIIVTQQDGNPVPKVIDFGIAKATNQRLTERTLFTRHAHIIGTPAYMSPEQAELSDLEVDTRTDVYSLGILLYELLTGTTPFGEEQLRQAGYLQMQKIICEQEPAKPSSKLSTLGETLTEVARWHNCSPQVMPRLVRGDLDWIVMKALEKDRRRRYDTAHGLANDVRRFLNQEPVEAGAPGVIYRCRKFILRHRTAVALAGLMGVSMVFATLVSLWQAAVATQARNETVVSLRHARRIAYLADMSVVQSSLDNFNVGRARRLLAAYRPRPGEEDLRDFEWFHFDRLTRADESTVLGEHPLGARALFAAPDGTFLTAFRHIVFNEFAGKLLFWDGASGPSQTQPLALDEVTAIALSADGTRLALARGVEIEIRLRDSPKVIETKLTNWSRAAQFSDEIVTLCFCQRDTRLAVACQFKAAAQSKSPADDSPVMLVEIDADRAIKPRVTSPLTRVLALAASEDGQSLAISEAGREVVILRLPEAVEVRRIPLPYSGQASRGLTPLLFVNQDRDLVTATDAGRIDLWETASGRHARMIGRHVSNVTAFAHSPDGTMLASVGQDQLIKLWDLQTPDTEPVRVLRGHEDEVWGVAFLPDGQSLVSCGRDESVRLWNLQPQASEDARWVLPAGTVEADLGVGFVAGGNAERRWRTWDISKFGGSERPQRIVPPESPVDAAWVPLPDGNHWLAVSNPVVEMKPGWGFHLTLFRGADSLERVEGFSAINLAMKADFHCTGRRLLIHGAIRGEPHLLVWDLDTEETVLLLRAFLGGDSTMAVSPDEQLVALGNLDGEVEVLDLGGETSRIFKPGKLSSIFSLAVMPDNRSAFAGGQPGILCKLDLATGAVTDSVPATLLGIHAMALSPGATRLATGDAQGKVKLWDVETMREVAVLGNHPGIVTDLQFQQEGRRLLSVDAGELRIYRADGLTRDESDGKK
jgi:WD40 repeat protein